MIQGELIPIETSELITNNTTPTEITLSAIKYVVCWDMLEKVINRVTPIPDTTEGAKIINCVRALSEIAEAKK